MLKKKILFVLWILISLLTFKLISISFLLFFNPNLSGEKQKTSTREM